MLSEANRVLIHIYEKGYRVFGGKVLSPFRSKPLCLRVPSHEYPVFSIRFQGRNSPVPVHRLLAYQKYGSLLFVPGIEVRHLDGDKLNFSGGNVVVGTHSENQLDKPKSMLKSAAVKAATKIRKFTDQKMEEIRRYHTGSYLKTMAEFGISSKGTLHYILNVEYQTKVP